MIVAITGGTGFVGRSLVARHCAKGDVVRVLSRRDPSALAFDPRVAFFPGDLQTDSAAIESFVAGADALYHCAGEWRQTELMRGVHVDGTARLVAAARGRIGRWVQLSSVGVYGRRAQEAITESTPCEPEGEYEQTKHRSDLLVRAAAAAGAFEHAIVRPANVFGPQMVNRSLFQWIATISRGLFCFVGPPGAAANYVFVDNVVAALEQCAIDARARNGLFNLSQGCDIETFVALIAAELGRPTPKLRAPLWPLRVAVRASRGRWGIPLTESRLQALCCRVRYPSDAIETRLGYRYAVSLQQGLRNTIAHWRTMRREQGS